MVKVAALGITAAVLGTVLRKSAPELGLLLSLAAGVWMLGTVAAGLGGAAELFRQLSGLAGLSEELVEPVAKTVAISILTRVTAEVCRSAGESGTAAFVETAGTLLALLVALPLIWAVTVLITEMLG